MAAMASELVAAGETVTGKLDPARPDFARWNFALSGS
jgi:hypothetical protein